MGFEPEAELSAEEVQERVDEAIETSDVVLFMKGNELMPQCGYSRQALALLQEHREDIETINVLEALDEYRAALDRHSGWETIPQAYAHGEFIGGSDVLTELHERGDLEDELRASTTPP